MANFCSQVLSGLTNDCSSNIGGIKQVYIANYDDVKSIQLGEGIITGITMNDSAKFQTYTFRKSSGSMVSNLNKDDTAGTQYVSTVLSLVFTKMETAKRIEISALSKGQLSVIVLDSNGKYWYLGYDEYVSATGGSGNSGTAKSDSNNYTIELTDESLDWPYEVEASALATIVA